MPDQPLNHKEQKVLEHLKANRPKMYRELLKSGQLENTVREMQRAYEDQMYRLEVEQKLPNNQAEELSRELRYPPSESDQPHLGENQNPLAPITTETTD